MYTIRPIIKMLLLALPALGAIVFALNVLKGGAVLQIREGMQRCRKALPFVVVVALVSGVFCMGYLWVGNPYAGSFKLSYTYPKASKGLTPNSTTLNTGEIFCDEVLEAAIATGSLGDLTPDEIRSTLRISNIKQPAGVSADALYVSTEYVVSYQASPRTATVDKDVILRTLADAYYEYFLENYGRKTDVLENDYAEVAELDYLDIHTYLSRQSSAVIEYMNMCDAENSTFVSEETQESFASMKDQARHFQEVSLDRYKSFVLKYGLSKGRQQYISRLNYENHMQNVEYMKNLAAYSVRLSAIDKYERDITRAVLVPTRDEDGEFYQSRTKIGTDYFADEADERLKNATQNQLTIETNNYYIDRLSLAKGSKSQEEKADKMVEGLKEELTNISEQAIATVKDYDEKTSNHYMDIVFQDRRGYVQSCLKKTALYILGFSGVWLAAIFTGFRFPWTKRPNSWKSV